MLRRKLRAKWLLDSDTSRANSDSETPVPIDAPIISLARRSCHGASPPVLITVGACPVPCTLATWACISSSI